MAKRKSEIRCESIINVTIEERAPKQEYTGTIGKKGDIAFEIVFSEPVDMSELDFEITRKLQPLDGKMTSTVQRHALSITRTDGLALCVSEERIKIALFHPILIAIKLFLTKNESGQAKFQVPDLAEEEME